MKNRHILLSIVLLLSFSTIGFRPGKEDKINWLTIEEAVELNKKKPKKIMIDIYTVWCGPCKRMNAETFTHPFIVDYINKNYYAVKFNAEGNDTIEFKGNLYLNPGYSEAKARTRNATHQLTKALAPVNGRIAYPTIVYMDEDVNVIQAVQGSLQPKQIEPILSYFASDSYQHVAWGDYQKEFISEIPE